MSGPEWHYEPDGSGGFDVYNVGYARRAANGLQFIAIIFALCIVVGAILSVSHWMGRNPLLMSQITAAVFFVAIPAIALLGVVQYPIVRIVDMIRRVRHPNHRFLRLWFLISGLMLLPVIVIPALLVAPHFMAHPHQAFHLVQLLIHDI